MSIAQLLAESHTRSSIDGAELEARDSHRCTTRAMGVGYLEERSDRCVETERCEERADGHAHGHCVA